MSGTTEVMMDFFLETSNTGGGQIVERDWKIKPKDNGCVVWYEVILTNKTIESDSQYFINLETNTVHPDNSTTVEYFYLGQYGKAKIYGPMEGFPLSE